MGRPRIAADSITVDSAGLMAFYGNQQQGYQLLPQLCATW